MFKVLSGLHSLWIVALEISASADITEEWCTKLNILVFLSAVFQTIEISRSPVPNGEKKKSNSADKAERARSQETASETQ